MAADLIGVARERSGLSQAALAEAAGTSRPTLSAYERGRKTPTASTLTRILDATGHGLALAPRVHFRTVSAARGAEYFVADRLWRLAPRDALRTVTLPHHLDWSPGDRTVDVLVARLRRRIPPDVAEIVTVHRFGYVLTLSK